MIPDAQIVKNIMTRLGEKARYEESPTGLKRVIYSLQIKTKDRIMYIQSWHGGILVKEESLGIASLLRVGVA